MGPLPVSESGHQYILVVTDVFTKWVEAFPLRDTVSTTLAKILVDEIICHYESPNTFTVTKVLISEAILYKMCEIC